MLTPHSEFTSPGSPPPGIFILNIPRAFFYFPFVRALKELRQEISCSGALKEKICLKERSD
jgi:hypothetical protein